MESAGDVIAVRTSQPVSGPIQQTYEKDPDVGGFYPERTLVQRAES